MDRVTVDKFRSKISEGDLYWNGLDQRSLILKLVLGCVSILYVGLIQTGHTDLLPPQS